MSGAGAEVAVERKTEILLDANTTSRQAARVTVSFEAEYSGRSVRGVGIVQNISATGALIEEAEPPLLSGGEVTLKFSIHEGSVPLSIRATVVRETDLGFAIEFIEMNPRTRKVLKLSIAKALRLADETATVPGRLGGE